jgi:hypothetical protein
VKEQLRILADASPITSDVFERIETLRQAVYQSADYLEGTLAFREKRPPKFTGREPTSLPVLLRKGMNKPLFNAFAPV